MKRTFHSRKPLCKAVLWALATMLMVVASASASADAAATWRFEPALAPPPPSGVAPAPYPVPVGTVGDVSFWAPNRGLLIDGGTQSAGGAVPAGLYAYDGVSWHELSSECGGAKGRIAWAGPDEFWTISDQRAGQVTSGAQSQSVLEALSLCHFQGDKIVGSYAMPLGEPGSYLQMDAAACLSPTDCWFAGQDGQPPSVGSFHLHWNGSEVISQYDSSDHPVTGMADFNGKLYEGLGIGAEDSYLPEEYLPEEDESGHPPLVAPKHPSVIRTIASAGQTQLCSGIPSVFCDLFVFSGQPLPAYQERELPDALGGFSLATDGSPPGVGATQLWAGADPAKSPPVGAGSAQVTILHDLRGGWTQVVPGTSGTSPLVGSTLSGSTSNPSPNRPDEPGAEAIAPVPGTESAWLSLEGDGNAAEVALLDADGIVLERDDLPEIQEDVGFRGSAGPIACPASNDCWMVTNPSRSVIGGWLFHLTDGAQLNRNSDPLFDGEDGVIAYRPPDSGVPTIYPDGFAEDDSLANQQPPPAPTAPATQSPVPVQKTKKGKPLVEHVKSTFLRHRVLVISFTLTARAHVQLIAREKRLVVAKTRDESLRAGRHRLSLTLNPTHWPTKLQFKAEPVGGSAPSNSGTSNSNDTIGT